MLPADTSASARPSATARAASTIEASGFERTAWAGLLVPADRDGRIHHLDVAPAVTHLGGRAEQQDLHAGAASALGDCGRPRSAPFASTAITG